MSDTGLLARFESPHDLVEAVKQIKKEGYTEFEAYSPFPIHGIENDMGLKPSKLPWIVLCGGLLGLIGGGALQTWVATTAYPLMISGKPLFSYPAFVPVTFELMILFSAFATVFGMFHLNKLPQWYYGLSEEPSFLTATSHSFFVTISEPDEQYDKEKTKAFLESLGGKDVKNVRI